MLSRVDIESALAERFGRRFCVLTNRGTTALSAAFYGLNRPAGHGVVFPAALCSIPVYAARFAGLTPLFADVSLTDGNFDLDSLEHVLRLHHGRVAAVVPVHMYGRVDNGPALEALCSRFRVDLVEDLALSLGAKRDGRRAGSWGRVVTLSFVRKILPVETGGAVLTDDSKIAERVRRFVDELPLARPAQRAETALLMKVFHGVTAYVAAGDWAQRSLLVPYEDQFRRLFLERLPEEAWDGAAILRELDSLPDVLQARRVRAEVYESALSHPLLKPLEMSGSSWFAYPVRLLGHAAEGFLKFAGERGLSFRRIAYPDVSRVFGSEASFANAALLEKELVGFPLDDDAPVSSFWEYAEDFAGAYRAYVESDPPPFEARGLLEKRMS